MSSGSGSFTATGDVISIHQADGNTIVTATEVQTLTGVLTGTRVASGGRLRRSRLGLGLTGWHEDHRLIREIAAQR